MQYTKVKESGQYWLLRRDDRYTVVRYKNNQVFSAMPGDMPRDGGEWFARTTDRGIAYVSSLYSRSYAYRVFSQLVQEDTAAWERGE